MAPRRFMSSSSESVTFDFADGTFEGYNIDTPASSVTLSKADAIALYQSMQTVRRLEMAADSSYKHKLIRGFCHLCTGQEAVPVGVEGALTKEDAIITAYRCHGFTYMRGGSPVGILAELMGRRDGVSKGKGGSMHMYAPNFYGGNGIVGAQVPLGAGIAFAQKYNESQSCTVALYGDGAANQGQVFESFNMAKLWDLPVIFVCENNKYGMGTAAARAAANTDYYTRGQYIPGIRVNGMDVLAVRQAIAYAREFAVSGKGPMVIEMKTYRYGGHSMSDPGTTYRTREEVQHMRSTSDPITGYKLRLIETGVATEADLKAIDKEAKNLIDGALAKAKAIPEPASHELWDDIYVKGSGVAYLRGRVPEETHHYN
ncbi:alpha subunit of pyruvate dehydrogenase [Coemansia sp. RSA 1813]|nr:alpha subunit of pyruvate dehydrogenase [Coemansia sp. RSA 1646]KAJ1766511.1 alpha subunit of pyruvate dehydrogenase [Coemansia sp. RSA 1843]KAJ2085649.1 alpha subunit of pyruvate dehydrogenase [Coemansia sp. RSA 986]KAJ2210542.1 alpha subunit of pyruvate dehydrogenase [Coemansia sp. RSA 487]KAJ2563184.1 alpha subunit of pyruvate dehydrogenase [Coemansia sp. RSA 1813]